VGRGRQHVPVAGPDFQLADLKRGSQVHRIAAPEAKRRRRKPEHPAHAAEHTIIDWRHRPHSGFDVLQKRAQHLSKKISGEISLAQAAVKSAGDFSDCQSR
jgi:hypothetical protein